MSQRFDAVIFDSDGVLIDTERVINGAWREVLARYGVELEYDAVFRLFGGFSIADNRARSEELLGTERGEAAFDAAGALIRRRFAEGIPRMPEVDAVLDQLTLPRALATNAPRSEFERKLEHAGLTGRFRHTVTASDVERPKPAPDIYLRAAELLAVPPDRCAVIEDSPTGIRAAVAAGMTVFGYPKDVSADKQREAGAAYCSPSLLALMREIERRVQSQQSPVASNRSEGPRHRGHR